MKTNHQNQLLRSVFNSGRLIGGRAPNRLARTCRLIAVALALVAGLGISAGRAQTNIYYQGLLNSMLGNALPDLDSNGHLVISGLGPSGNDGVQIATLGAAAPR
jgi:hypothetical protein